MFSSDLLKILFVGSYPLIIICNKEPPPTTSVCFGYIRGQNDFDSTDDDLSFPEEASIQ